MDKTLNILQTLAKIGKIISKIGYVCSIIGAIGCAAGIASLAAGATNVLKIGGVTIHGLIEQSDEMSIGSMYMEVIVGLICCIGAILLTRRAVRYFTNELEAGTPFTLDGAKEMLHLGIWAVCVPVGVVIASSIAHEIIDYIFPQIGELSLSSYISPSIGIALIIISVICRYGAEVRGEREDEALTNAGNELALGEE